MVWCFGQMHGALLLPGAAGTSKYVDIDMAAGAALGAV